MRQLIALLALSVVLAAASLIGLAANVQAILVVCPDGFVPAGANMSPDSDKNHNGYICAKEKDGRIGEFHYTDDKM